MTMIQFPYTKSHHYNLVTYRNTKRFVELNSLLMKKLVAAIKLLPENIVLPRPFSKCQNGLFLREKTNNDGKKYDTPIVTVLAIFNFSPIAPTADLFFKISCLKQGVS